MAEYTLHCFAQSGNAYKAALALELAGADWSPRFVDYFGGETRTPAYRQCNVMGEVPVLAEFGEDWSTYSALREWLARIAATPRWQHSYALMPGHPRPAAA